MCFMEDVGLCAGAARSGGRCMEGGVQFDLECFWFAYCRQQKRRWKRPQSGLYIWPVCSQACFVVS